MSLTNARNCMLVFLPSGWGVEVMRPILCGLVVLGLFLGAGGQVRSEFIYWANVFNGNIQRANLDGTGETILVSGQAAPVGPTLDLAGGKMYWGNLFGGDIRRANLDGTDQATILTKLNAPAAPALDLAFGQMYWNYSY